MKKLLLSLFVLLVFAQAVMADTFKAGTDYTIINANAPQQAQVKVIEFFNYGCPWCAHLEPTVAAWLKTKPAYINFQRIPVAFEQGWDTYSKAYYIAQALGIEAKITPALFKAIHGADDMQNNDLSSKQAITAFFVQQGVAPSVANNAFSGNSASLDLKVQQSLKTMKSYKVWAIPTFVIGEKYTVSLEQAKSPQRFIQIVNYLTALARKK